ncbi:hypothetical protein TrVE_jg8269 [Triparma verrucosa]|uniref:G-protein coupled receptors family 3 profile domain-containing protein n=1 Tax=Triparma verrucosa TaxID=1606542 RepID=A0A9W6Z8N3_9STRA|nr:hypothetical protein TrVE_jg8269 [Triparma verrucosa]
MRTSLSFVFVICISTSQAGKWEVPGVNFPFPDDNDNEVCVDDDNNNGCNNLCYDSNQDHHADWDDPTCFSRCYNGMAGGGASVFSDETDESDLCSYYIENSYEPVGSNGLSPFAYLSGGRIVDTCASYYTYGFSASTPTRILLGCKECADGYEPEERDGKTEKKLDKKWNKAVRWGCILEDGMDEPPRDDLIQTTPPTASPTMPPTASPTPPPPPVAVTVEILPKVNGDHYRSGDPIDVKVHGTVKPLSRVALFSVGDQERCERGNHDNYRRAYKGYNGRHKSIISDMDPYAWFQKESYREWDNKWVNSGSMGDEDDLRAKATVESGGESGPVLSSGHGLNDGVEHYMFQGDQKTMIDFGDIIPSASYSICSGTRYSTEDRSKQNRILTAPWLNWFHGHQRWSQGNWAKLGAFYAEEWLLPKSRLPSSTPRTEWVFMCTSYDDDSKTVKIKVNDQEIETLSATEHLPHPERIVINAPDGNFVNERSDFMFAELFTFKRALNDEELENAGHYLNTFKTESGNKIRLYTKDDTVGDFFAAVEYCPTNCDNSVEGRCRGCESDILDSERSEPVPITIHPAITNSPTKAPTIAPTGSPTSAPTFSPTIAPTYAPTQSTCTNGQLDKENGETDVDCGGPNCFGCDDRKLCEEDDDCKSNSCQPCLSELCDAFTGTGSVCVAATIAPSASPTKAPSMAPTTSPPTMSPTSPPTTMSPTMAPTFAPTTSPTTSPTAVPTSLDTMAPTAFQETVCGVENKCLKGTESCCNSISSNIFVTSKITQRILFYDLKSNTFVKFLEHTGKMKETVIIEEDLDDELLEYETESSFTMESDKLSMSKHHGASQIAFSPSGREIYFTRSADSTSKEEGSLEAFHAQTGEHAYTVLSSTQFFDIFNVDSNGPFDPYALRIFDNNNGTNAWFFSEKNTNSLYSAWTTITKNNQENQEFRTLFTSPRDCSIVDFAVESNENELARRGELIILVLCTCKSTADQVHMILENKDFAERLLDLPDTVDARSIEFVPNHHGVLSERFYVGVHPKDIDREDEEPHIYERSTIETEYSKAVLKLSDLQNTRLGLDVGMIRRNHNGLCYVSEMSHGLPLIMNATLPDDVKVIGQTGDKLGDLADSYAIAFNPNTFGLNSEVVINVPEQVSAGAEISLQVVLKNSNNEPVNVETFLEGTISGHAGRSLSTSEMKIEEKIPSSKFQQRKRPYLNVYDCSIKVQTASKSDAAEEDKFELKLEVAGLGMQIGDPLRFWITPGPTAASKSRLLKTYSSSNAGESIEITIETYDEWGNRRDFVSGYDEDLLDLEKFELTKFVDNSTTTNEDTSSTKDFEQEFSRVSPGLFKVKITSKLSGAFTFRAEYDGEDLSNSPFNVVVLPGAVNVTNSEAMGNGLEFFEPKSGVLDNSFDIFMKDSFGNIVPGKSCADNVNIDLVAVKKDKKSQNVFAGSAQKKFEESRKRVEVKKILKNDGSIKVSFTVAESDYDKLELSVNFTEPSGSFESKKAGSESSIKYTKKNGETIDLSRMDVAPTRKDEKMVVGMYDLLIITAFSAFVSLYTLLVAGLVHYWRNENAIKFSQRRLLNLLLLGAFIVNLAITVQTVPGFIELESSCTIVSWGGVMGIALIFVSVGAKLYRVKELAFAKANKKVRITDGYLVKRILLYMGSLAGYMAFATIIAPMKLEQLISPDPIEVDEVSGTKTYGVVAQCNYTGSQLWFPVWGALVILFVAVLVMASQTRKLHSAFSETRWIAHSVYTFVVCLCMIFLLISDDRIMYKFPAKDKYFRIIPLSLGSFIFVNLMFLPKFNYIMKQEKIELTDLTKALPKKSSVDGLGGEGAGGEKQSFSGKHSGNLAVSSFKKRDVVATTTTTTTTATSDATSRPGMGRRESSFSTKNPMASKEPSSKKMQRLEKENERLNALLMSQKQIIATSGSDFFGGPPTAVLGEEGWVGRESSVSMVMPSQNSDWQMFHDAEGHPYYYREKDGKCQYDAPADI